MPTLYVENVPEDLYTAIRGRAQANRSSISAEVLALLAENVATPAEIKRRKGLIARLSKLQSKAVAAAAGAEFVSAEEMLRQDRSR